MNVSDYIFCFVAGFVILFFASLLWSEIGRLTDSTSVPWYRRLFWRKTLEDLMAELQSGKRSEISGAEVELAKAYERRQMPSGIRFPKAGEIYEAMRDFEVSYMTAHHAPHTGGGRAVLPKGERVRVCEPSGPEPLSVSCDPLNYETLHERIVSAEERSNERYAGYYLSIDTVDLNRCFKLVESLRADGKDKNGG